MDRSIEEMLYTNLPICEKNELERWPLRVLQSSLQRKLSTDHQGWILQLSEYFVWTRNVCRILKEGFLLTGDTEFSKSRLKKMRATDTYTAAIFNQILNHLTLSLHTWQRQKKQKRKVTWRKNHLPGLGKPYTRISRVLIQLCHTEVLRTLIS